MDRGIGPDLRTPSYDTVVNWYLTWNSIFVLKSVHGIRDHWRGLKEWNNHLIRDYLLTNQWSTLCSNVRLKQHKSLYHRFIHIISSGHMIWWIITCFWVETCCHIILCYEIIFSNTLDCIPHNLLANAWLLCGIKILSVSGVVNLTPGNPWRQDLMSVCKWTGLGWQHFSLLLVT